MKNLITTIFLISGIASAGSPAVKALSEPVLLVEQDQYLMNPEWSPDGNHLAVTGTSYSGLYLYSFTGNEIRELSDKMGAGYGMAWSHDSKSIATRISKYENRRRWSSIAIYSIDDGQEKLITGYVKRLQGRPVWTTNDDRIFMTSAQAKIYQVPGKAISGNRSGEIIIQSNRNKIYQYDLALDNISELVEAGNDILVEEVSPDGQCIAYQVYGGNLWVINIGSGVKTDLGIGEHPTWSADSKKIAYMITEDDGHQITQSDIYVINIDGTGKVNLTAGSDSYEMHPDWSPDGRWIAYDTNEDGKIWMQEVQ